MRWLSYFTFEAIVRGRGMIRGNWCAEGLAVLGAFRGFTYALCLVLGVAFVVSCALPGTLYRVSPAITGEIAGVGPVDGGARIELRVTHRESSNLFQIQKYSLSEGQGSFVFRPVELAIAGHEYSKVYRVYLHYVTGSSDWVIWRAEFSRETQKEEIVLDCDLVRPARLGQPCQVEEPLRHAWLLANGKRTYDRLCVGCHGESGETSNPELSAQRRSAMDLTRISARNGGAFDPVAVAEWVEGSVKPRAHGSGEMPVWGERLSKDFRKFSSGDELVGATLDPLIAYLRSIQR